jgi:ribosome-binding protein aMBF1 (putative translation factor)
MNFKEYKAQLLADPETKEEYDRLEPEYELIRSIIRERLRQNMSQEQLAEKIGTQTANIARLENPNFGKSLPMLKKIAEALDCRLVIKLEPNS